MALCIIVIPRWRKGRYAPYAAIIALEITTTIFWLCAFIGLALFAVEVEPLCLLADESLIVKRMIESCVIIKTATAVAGVSWYGRSFLIFNSATVPNYYFFLIGSYGPPLGSP